MAEDDTRSFALGDAEGVLAAVMRNAADGMALLDLDGHVLRWNSAAEEIYGWRQFEVLGAVAPFIPADERVRFLAAFREAASSGRVWDIDLLCVRSDGARLTSRVAAIPVTDTDGDAAGAVMIVRDTITDERFDRHREDFSALVARHLVDPLRALTAQVGLLARKEVWSEEGRWRAVVDAAGESAKHAARLAERLAQLSEFDRAPSLSACDNFDPNELLAGILSDVPAGKVSAALEFSHEHLAADRRAVAAALRALLDRAIPSATDGPISVTTSWRDDGWVVEVLDPGWAGEVDDDVRVDSGQTARPESAEASIASALAAAVFRAHGGTFSVERKDGGARISLHLPRESRALPGHPGAEEDK